MAGIVEAAALDTSAPRRKGGANGAAWLLLAPASLFLVLFFVLPIGYVLLLSIFDPGPTLKHYRHIVEASHYLGVLLNTFRTALIVTVLSFLLGYPIAYVMARRNDVISAALLIIVGMSFWTGFLVRTYAWLVILGNRGPVVGLYDVLGLGRPPQLLFTSFSSILGMTHILLPFFVLALYGVMRKIDPNHLRAAESLGATPFATFWNVFLPLSLPGVVNGAVLVFTMCLGFYVTPILLGTPKDMMISQLISQQIEDLLAWGFASALAVVLLVATVTFMAIYNRFASLDRLWG